MIYKIKIYTHKLKATISDDIKKLTDYFQSDFVKQHIPSGISLDISIEETLVSKEDSIFGVMTPNDGKYDVVIYMYERNLFPAISFGLAFKLSKTLRGVFLASDLLSDGVDYTWKSMAHEIMHTLFYKFDINYLDPMDRMEVNGVMTPYYKNEDLFADDGNFAEGFKRLAPYIKSMNTYKYFKPSEIVGLKPELVGKLDLARGIAGVPFVITSGNRTKEKNASVGGVEDSSHTTGLAVDLLVKDGVTGGKILLALAQVGFKRFGFYKDGHIHVDCDLSKPNPCYWVK